MLLLLLAATTALTQNKPTAPQSRLVCPSMQYHMHAQCLLSRAWATAHKHHQAQRQHPPSLPGDLTSAVLKLPMVNELPDTCTTCPNSVSALTVRWTMLYCDDMLLAA